MACVNTLCQNGRCRVCGGLGFFYGSQCQSCYGTGKCMLCGGTGGQGVSQTWWPVFGRFVSDNGKSFLRVTSGTVGYFVSLWEVLLPGPYSARKEGDYYVLTAFNHPTVRVAIDLSKAHVEYNGVGGWHSLCSEEEYLRRFEVYKANNEVPRLVEGSPVQPSYGSGNQNAGATNGSVNEKRDCYMCVDGQCPVCTWHHGKCHHCNGSGQMYNSYTSDYQRCSYCNGRGNCYKCNGSGKCYRCHGKGYL